MSKGGVVIKIDRPELDEKEKEEADQHKSELFIDKINNYNGSGSCAIGRWNAYIKENLYL